MSKIRIRVVNKSKDGITLSPAKGAEHIKMTWDEFNENYSIVDKVWAVMNDAMQAKYDEMEKYLNELVVDVVITRHASITDISTLARMARIGENCEKVQNLLNCSVAQVKEIIQKRIDMLEHDFGMDQKKRYRNQHREVVNKDRENNHEVKGVTNLDLNTSAVMEDNPILKRLREEAAAME